MARVCLSDNIRCEGADGRNGGRVGWGGDEVGHDCDAKVQKTLRIGQG
jgi:hypothetical protein